MSTKVKSRTSSGDTAGAILIGVFALIVISAIWGFIVHLYWTITGLLTYQIDTIPEIAVAILGIIFPPFGVIHGLGVFTGLVAWGV